MPASSRFTIHVASVAASATVPVVGMAHGEIVGGSVSRRDEIGGSKHQTQDGQDGECDCLHGILSSDVRAVAVGFVAAPASSGFLLTDGEWEADWESALKSFTPRQGVRESHGRPPSRGGGIVCLDLRRPTSGFQETTGNGRRPDGLRPGFVRKTARMAWAQPGRVPGIPGGFSGLRATRGRTARAPNQFVMIKAVDNSLLRHSPHCSVASIA